MASIKTFDELLKEGDEIARGFYRRCDKEFNLQVEAFCKKMWQPWFNAGQWKVLDLTQPQSAMFQVEKLDVPENAKIEMRRYLHGLDFPCDVIAWRGEEFWFCDYKFKPNTKAFIGIEKMQYFDAYNKRRFLFLIWANDRRKRYMLWANRDPKEYKEVWVRDVPYYDVTADCVEIPPMADTPIEMPIPKGGRDYWAFRKRLNDLASTGFFPKEVKPERADYEWAVTKFEESVSLQEAAGIPLRMLEEEVERTKGWEYKVLEPIWPHKKEEKASIIGFDTEFYEDKLLSVQFAAMDKDGCLKSKVIMEGLEGYDARKLLKDALEFLKECDIKPQRRIYLIAHFALSDIGHLSNCLRDFRFRVINKALHAEYVKPEPDEVEFEAKELKLGDYKMRIVDLFAYYPSSLAKIGEMIGLSKIEVDRKDIMNLYKSQPEKFKEYAARDAEIALMGFLKLRDFAWKYKVEALRCPSIASIAGDIFRINYLRRRPSPVTLTFEFSPYRKPSGEWSKRRVKKPRYALKIDLRHLALLCLWGGRAECYVHGLIEGDFTLYDVASLYPASAILQPLPNEKTEWIEITRDNFDPKMEGFVCVKFKFPSNTRYPCLPVAGRLEDRLYFPLEGVSYCTIAELREALKMGCEIEEIRGYGFLPSESEIDHDLKRFVQDMLKLKAEYPKGSLSYETFKLIANSLIGKLAQRRCEDDLDFARQLFVTHGVPLAKKFKGPAIPGPCWCPEWAALVLGKARALMSQFISKGALMAVTDSVLLPSNVDVECEALNELRSVGSDLKVEISGIKRVFIVRTRLYALMDEKGEIVKEAHHAVHLESSQVREIIKKCIEAGYDLDLEGNRDHIIKLREALQKGKPLGYSELKPSKIYFKWDWKRVLDNPMLNMFRERSDTKPIRNVVEFENEIFEFMRGMRKEVKRLSPEIIAKAQSLRAEGLSYRRIADELGISIGRLRRILKGEGVERKRISQETVSRVQSLRAQGLSYRDIAKALNISLSKVQRSMKAMEKS